jgi:rSAM/selenodomain-associated transferase 1
MHSAALIIFVKNPVPGKVKTRLAKTIGEHEAAAIYIQLLQHTNKITSTFDADKFIYYADFVNDNDLWNNYTYKKLLQVEGDLGHKMLDAFENSFLAGYKKVVIIGSDSIEIEKHHIQQAFEMLDNSDVVIGPAQDGGYYLLGLKQFHTFLFLNKSWSSSKLMQETLDDIEKHRLSYHLLPVLSDIDEEKDLFLLEHRQ